MKKKLLILIAAAVCSAPIAAPAADPEPADQTKEARDRPVKPPDAAPTSPLDELLKAVLPFEDFIANGGAVDGISTRATGYGPSVRQRPPGGFRESI